MAVFHRDIGTNISAEDAHNTRISISGAKYFISSDVLLQASAQVVIHLALLYLREGMVLQLLKYYATKITTTSAPRTDFCDTLLLWHHIIHSGSIDSSRYNHFFVVQFLCKFCTARPSLGAFSIKTVTFKLSPVILIIKRCSLFYCNSFRRLSFLPRTQDCSPKIWYLSGWTF